ncbi:Protein CHLORORESPIRATORY REDUCTION 7, chloroplastic [Linum perenne]
MEELLLTTNRGSFIQLPALLNSSASPQLLTSNNCLAATTVHCFPPISLNLSSPVLPISVKQVWARRRRREEKSDTYVLLEPGKDETFVSEDELKVKLKSYLENWPTKTLPPDLARFEDMEEAVSFLVGSACELEIDGDVGSLQWYQVRLE